MRRLSQKRQDILSTAERLFYEYGFRGISGAIIDKRGLRYAFNLGVIALALATIALAFTPKIWIIPFISASLFGLSYIFLTGVLLVWGIKIFVKNASLGIGIPFLMLAIGQVIGSSLAGLFIDMFNFMYTFIIYGLIGFTPLFIYPKVEVLESKLPDGDYSQLQQQNAEILTHESMNDTHDQYTHHQHY
ncbi:hypothetical protein [Staphylococcus cohnii]|uniref:hypothetical protein n=1 Tax=Staphylococcus cohnii TaxID=29382 RepID=UPI00299F7E74|nr:hypothetical protein [Staphylococcus cohnii]